MYEKFTELAEDLIVFVKLFTNSQPYALLDITESFVDLSPEIGGRKWRYHQIDCLWGGSDCLVI